MTTTDMERSPSAGRSSKVAQRTEPAPAPAPRHHPWRHFGRHYAEMAAVMAVGMVAAAALYMTIVNLMVEPISWEEALIRYPVQSLLVVAVGMSLPMIPWMRRRGHSRRSSWEMAAAMALPVIPFACLAWFGVVEGAQCGLYCIVGFVAMLALMLYRRAEYADPMA